MGIYYPNFVVFYVLSPSVPPLHRQLRQLPGSGGIPMSQKKKTFTTIPVYSSRN